MPASGLYGCCDSECHNIDENQHDEKSDCFERCDARGKCWEGAKEIKRHAHWHQECCEHQRAEGWFNAACSAMGAAPLIDERCHGEVVEHKKGADRPWGQGQFRVDEAHNCPCDNERYERAVLF